jgi:hypothetical protein
MGVAAGAAMAFAVIATIFASQHFANNSIPWAAIIIVAYIVKDRIKELLRNALIVGLSEIGVDSMPSYFRYRLVLTREGIVRIEEVEKASSSCATAAVFTSRPAPGILHPLRQVMRL